MPFRWNPVARWPTAPAEAAAGSGAAGAPAVLDAQALARLRELDPSGKAGLLQRVLGTYAQSLRRLLDQLGAARDAGNAAAMRHAAHTLKSSSASVGAVQLSALCADLEARVRDGQLHGLEQHVDQLTTEGRRILAHLEAPGGVNGS